MLPAPLVLQSVEKLLLTVQLGLLDPKAALELFRQHTQVVDPEQHGLAQLESDIVTACGALPLALQITGGRLSSARQHQHAALGGELLVTNDYMILVAPGMTSCWWHQA
jgi:hypothetical protein